MRRIGLIVAVVCAVGLLATETNAQGRFWVLVNGALKYVGNVVVDGRLQFGCQTASCPMWVRSGTTLQAKLADNSDNADISVKNINVNSRVTLASGSSYDVVNKAIYNTAPTISSGFGTSPSIVAHNGTAAFTINVGTGGSASTGVIGLPAANAGWAVSCANTSTNTATVFVTKQTAFTSTTATIGNYDAAGAAAAWVASNVLVCKAMAF